MQVASAPEAARLYAFALRVPKKVAGLRTQPYPVCVAEALHRRAAGRAPPSAPGLSHLNSGRRRPPSSRRARAESCPRPYPRRTQKTDRPGGCHGIRRRGVRRHGVAGHHSVQNRVLRPRLRHHSGVRVVTAAAADGGGEQEHRAGRPTRHRSAAAPANACDIRRTATDLSDEHLHGCIPLNGTRDPTEARGFARSRVGRACCIFRSSVRHFKRDRPSTPGVSGSRGRTGPSRSVMPKHVISPR
jgi:hypothetical protein